MADNEEGEEPTSRGNEWEVVSLTASAYAAAPGSKGVEVSDDNQSNAFEENEAETSKAMFMSRHFVFPPSQHENLPVEPDDIEIQQERKGEDVVSELNMEEGDRSNKKGEEDWDIKGLSAPDDFPGLEFVDEKGNKLSLHGTDFESSTTLQGLNLVDKEHNIYSAANFSSFRSETIVDGSTTYEINTDIPETIDPSDQGLDLPADVPQSPKSAKEEMYDGPDLPCEAWWKRRAGSLYGHAKEANTFWSIFIAAAVMGLVILGQRWQQERWQVLQLKWQFTVGDEKMGKMMGPISRLKDVIVGGHRRGSFIRGSASGEH